MIEREARETERAARQRGAATTAPAKTDAAAAPAAPAQPAASSNAPPAPPNEPPASGSGERPAE
jgi:hypothetical protein